MRMDLGMRSTSHYDSMPCMTVASLEMSDEPKKCRITERQIRSFETQLPQLLDPHIKIKNRTDMATTMATKFIEW